MRVGVVIDVEMCPVQKRVYKNRFSHSNEIIQIGAVMLNEEFEIIDEFCTFIRPVFGEINYFIQNLTGITERDIKIAPLLETALHHMLDWIGDREPLFYSWSETDFYQIRGEILSKGINIKGIGILLNGNNWVDYQKTIMSRFDLCRAISLSDALTLTDLFPEGRLHDGLADAYNTARVIAELERHPEKRYTFEKVCQHDEAPFGTSLGSLLQGVVLGTV